MPDPAIIVDGLWKRYHKRFGASTLWSLLGARERTDDEFWALRDVSFEVQPGECLGIIGPNGSGKSTLLKILSRITNPTKGRVRVNGRVASMLEVGTGFHSELTGRENVYLSGAIMGMSQAEIRKRFDAIVAFSGVEDFIDVPVKRYSSGMYVRLAFAVAAHVETDILICDEVLAVGDAAFQQRCMGKMGEAGRLGRTVLFVSHSMAAVSSICQKACLIRDGRVAQAGPTDLVIATYMRVPTKDGVTWLNARTDRQGDGTLRFTSVGTHCRGTPASTVLSGDSLDVIIDYEAHEVLSRASVSLGFYGAYGHFMLWCNNELIGTAFQRLPQRGRIVCTIPRLPFTPGSYTINVYAEVNGAIADWVQQAHAFQVAAGDFYGTGRVVPAGHGGLLADQRWTCSGG